MKPHIITVVVEKWRRYHGRLGAGPDKGDNWSHRMLFEVVLFGFRPAKPKGFVRSPGISFQSLLFHRKFNELREKRWDRTTTVLPGTRGPDPEEFAGGDGGGAAGLGSANSGGEVAARAVGTENESPAPALGVVVCRSAYTQLAGRPRQPPLRRRLTATQRSSLV